MKLDAATYDNIRFVQIKEPVTEGDIERTDNDCFRLSPEATDTLQAIFPYFNCGTTRPEISTPEDAASVFNKLIEGIIKNTNELMCSALREAKGTREVIKHFPEAERNVIAALEKSLEEKILSGAKSAQREGEFLENYLYQCVEDFINKHTRAPETGTLTILTFGHTPEAKDNYIAKLSENFGLIPEIKEPVRGPTGAGWYIQINIECSPEKAVRLAQCIEIAHTDNLKSEHYAGQFIYKENVHSFFSLNPNFTPRSQHMLREDDQALYIDQKVAFKPLSID